MGDNAFLGDIELVGNISFIVDMEISRGYCIYGGYYIHE